MKLREHFKNIFRSVCVRFLHSSISLSHYAYIPQLAICFAIPLFIYCWTSPLFRNSFTLFSLRLFTYSVTDSFLTRDGQVSVFSTQVKLSHNSFKKSSGKVIFWLDLPISVSYYRAIAEHFILYCLYSCKVELSLILFRQR